MFRLNRRKPLRMPTREANAGAHHGAYRTEDLFMSSNYFNLKWSGERRLRNIVLVLEWVLNFKVESSPDLP